MARHDIPKVIGGLDPQASEIAAALYGSIFRRTVPVSSPAAAEMTKLLENIYRCVNIALVNELKMLCLRMDLNIWEIIDAAATKPFGFHPFYPGPGLGGHCIPVDPFYLSWKAKEFDFRTRFIELAGEINVAMPYNVIASTISALNQQKKAINGSKVLVLGVAYKKDIDDLRESPALTIIELLQKEGAVVSYNDPYFPFVGRGRKYDLQMKCSLARQSRPVRLRAHRHRPHRLRLQEDRQRGQAGGGFAQRHPRHQERQDRALLAASSQLSAVSSQLSAKAFLFEPNHVSYGTDQNPSPVLVCRVEPGQRPRRTLHPYGVPMTVSQ